MIEKIRNLDNPIHVIFVLDQLGVSVELLNIIDDGEIKLEVELVKDAANREKLEAFLASLRENEKQAVNGLSE